MNGEEDYESVGSSEIIYELKLESEKGLIEG